MEIIILSLVSILMLAIPGYILSKCKLVGQDGLKILGNILLYITTPVLIFVNFQKMPYSPEMTVNMLMMFALTLASFILIAVIVISIWKPQKHGNSRKLFAFGVTFANSGYMAIPFIEAIFPGDALAIMYSSIFLAIFNIMVWTLGIYYMTGDRKAVSLKKAVINPAVIAVLFSLPLFFLNIRISDFSTSIFGSFSSIGNMNTPVSMIVLGIKLAETKMSEILKHKLSYWMSLLKLIVFPLLIFAVLILPFKGVVDQKVLQIFFVSVIMPGAAITSVFAEKYLGDGKDAAIYFLLSTCLSLITIPFMMELMNTI